MPLKDAEEPRLQRRAQFTNLIEEDGPAVGGLEIANVRFAGAARGALLLAEERAIQPGPREAMSRQSPQRLFAAVAAAVECARDLLLAGARLALHQDADVLFCDSFERGEELSHRRTRPIKLAERLAIGHR